MCIKTNATLKKDPTQTTTLRNKFARNLGARYRNLKGKINDFLVEGDAFGLKANAREFAFKRDDQKLAEFMEWIDDQEKSIILGISPTENTENALFAKLGSLWTTSYVNEAYQKGVSQAATRMRKSGGSLENKWIDKAIQRPAHFARSRLAAARVFMELDGINEAMDKEISRVIARGLAEGLNPRVIARQINNRIDKIGITRAKTLARTEVISAHADAALNAYEEAGIEGVEVEAEFSTAGDGRVCPECQSLEGRVYTIKESRGIIPVHPNCRCTFIPVIKEGESINL